MDVSAYKQRNLGIISLPTDIKYRNWSKDLTKWRIENDAQLAQYITYDNKYRLNKNTLAVYEFKQNPILGKYKAVAFDLNRGIVLSQKSTHAMMQGLMRHAVHCDMIWQRMLAREAGVDIYQGIVMYNVLYFSMHLVETSSRTGFACTGLKTSTSNAMIKLFSTVLHLMKTAWSIILPLIHLSRTSQRSSVNICFIITTILACIMNTCYKKIIFV